MTPVPDRDAALDRILHRYALPAEPWVDDAPVSEDCLDPETAHGVSIAALRSGLPVALSPRYDMRLKVSVARLAFDNPLLKVEAGWRGIARRSAPVTGLDRHRNILRRSRNISRTF